MACGSERPVCTSSSSTSSNIAESLPRSSITGTSFCTSSPNTGARSTGSREAIQRTLPRSVLISPLCATRRYGCALAQLGKVFVEKRWCTSAMAVSARGSARSR